MPFSVTQTVLSDSVRQNATFYAPFPLGTSASTFTGASAHKLRAGGGSYSAPTDFTVAFGSDGVAVTWLRANPLQKGSVVYLQLDVLEATSVAAHTHAQADVTGLSASLSSLASTSLSNVSDANFLAKAVAAGVGASLTARFVINPHAAPYNARGGAVGEADGVVAGGNTLASAKYTFTSADIGKIVYIAGSSARNITAVAAGVATFDGAALSSGSSRQWFCGHDDTAALQAALTAAKIVGASVTGGASSSAAGGGAMAIGGYVELDATGYLISNSQADYDGGKIAALVVARRTSLVGKGINATHLYLGIGNIGHGICNENQNGYDDFIQMSGFSLFCNGGYQPSGCLDGIRHYAAFNGYQKIDTFSRYRDIFVHEAKRDGFYFNGRGEMIIENLMAQWCARYGLFFDGLLDSRVSHCNSGGAQYSGIRINRCANVHYTNCKSFYSGASGGSTPGDCANWYVTADQPRNGYCFFTTCEGQEARGSNWVIESGYNQLIGCIGSDPSRDPLGGATGRPTVRASFHLRTNGGTNAYRTHLSGCRGGPSLTVWDASPHGGTHLVYIDAGVTKCSGDVWAFDDVLYEDANNRSTTNGSNGTAGAILGGTGSSNGTNTNLRVEGTYCT